LSDGPRKTGVATRDAAGSWVEFIGLEDESNYSLTPSLRPLQFSQPRTEECSLKRVQVIDSHTGGEPTRIVIEGGPDLGNGSLQTRRQLFQRDHEAFRRALVTEPRASDATVGALLCEPTSPECIAGVIFFNNRGCLGMCGHGTMGLLVTLAYLGKVKPGHHRVETPVGIVGATLNEDNTVTVENIPSYRYAAGLEIEVPGYGLIAGDIAWGGNWFFLVRQHPYTLDLANLDQLMDFTWAIRQSLAARCIRGPEDAEIDHIELHGPGSSPDLDSRNFVLCPGKEYDRSPCGTGTSAKLACLYDDGLFTPGQVWRQESVIGSIFEARIAVRDGKLLPSITGSAFITAESTLILDPQDAFCWGIPVR
jgi:4-hydroxyproline epimerase